MSAPRRGQASPFGKGIPLGRYGGVRVDAHWSVLVIVTLLTELLAASVLPDAAPHHSRVAYIGIAAAAAVVFLVGLLAHELAHALVARHYGMPVQHITLWMLGGITELGGEPQSPRADARIAAAGPATSLLLGGGFAGLAWVAGGGLLGSALAWLAVVNVFLGGFNLLPGAPLDGGRLLRALLWRHYQDRARAADIAARVGRALGFTLLAVGVLEVFAGALTGVWLALIGWFIAAAAAAERHQAFIEQTGDLQVRDVMTPLPTLAPGWLTVAEFVTRLTPEQLREPAFAVVGFDAHPEGVLTAADLARVPAQHRGTLRVRDACHPHPLTITPDTRLADLVAPIKLHRGVAVVLADGHVVGVITAADLARAATAARLGWHHDRNGSRT
jgi:Zn-dependent protease